MPLRKGGGAGNGSASSVPRLGGRRGIFNSRSVRVLNSKLLNLQGFIPASGFCTLARLSCTHKTVEMIIPKGVLQTAVGLKILFLIYSMNMQ